MKRSELELSQVFGIFTEHRIQPIVIKGWAAARNYPLGHFRGFTDIDLAVERKDYDAARLIVKSGSLGPYNIDLHCELRHLDLTPWTDLFRRSVTTELEGVQVRTLCPEDHLRVLCAHWLNDGGEYRERLWDIYYAVQNRPDDFDWDTCLNTVPTNRRNWVITAIMLAHEHLGLDITRIPIQDEERVVPRWVARTIEREWKSDVRLIPLSTTFNDRKSFWQQLMKRLPPNPIQATIETDAAFDEKARMHLRVLTALRRLWAYFRKK